MSRGWITLAALLAAAPVGAHAGHSNRAAWDACAGRASGAPCAWQDDQHNRAVGTCRQFGVAMLCVRQRPMIPAPMPQVRR
jgi:hypothetical protein